MQKILIVGAGLAGSEAAMFLAKKGIPVLLAESKRKQLNPAQKSEGFAELVCTNSLKSLQLNSGHGLLKNEMHSLDSFILRAAYHAKVPAGNALSVDREKFSNYVTDNLEKHPLITIKNEIVSNPLEIAEQNDCSHIIIATGPLTSSPLEEWIKKLVGEDDFYFYDAIAPIVDADSLDYSKLYWRDRRSDNKGKQDYLNAPFTKEEYYEFISEIDKSEIVGPKNFEEAIFFEQCLPIDIMAKRGAETLRFGPLRAIGLEDSEGNLPYAVLQLRRENLKGDAFNLVGMQSRMTYGSQKKVFRKVPGLENAEFLTLGSVHRNSYLNSKKHLNIDFSSKELPKVFFAGQITGVEGYTESAMSGLYVALQLYRRLNNNPILTWPLETATGALVNHILTQEKPTPTNVHFGIFPPLDTLIKGSNRKMIKKDLISLRALKFFKDFYFKNFYL